jgi:hypothetical protein
LLLIARPFFLRSTILIILIIVVSTLEWLVLGTNTAPLHFQYAMLQLPVQMDVLASLGHAVAVVRIRQRVLPKSRSVQKCLFRCNMLQGMQMMQTLSRRLFVVVHRLKIKWMLLRQV